MAFNPISIISATPADGTFSTLGATVHNAGVTNILTGNAGRFILEGAGPVVGDDAGATFTGTGATFVATLNGLTVTAAPTFSALTQYRIPVAGAAGLLGDFAGLVWASGGTAGRGLDIAAGTATTDVSAYTGAQTWNNAAVTFSGAYKWAITDQAGNAGSAAASIHSVWLGGTAGATTLVSFSKVGTIKINTGGGTPMLTGQGGEFLRWTGSAWSVDNASIGVNFGSSITVGTSFSIGNPAHLLMTGTAPTISSGFGTNPSIASNNGTATFRVDVGTGGTASTGVIGLPTATAGWNAMIEVFNANATNMLQDTIITASANNSITLGNFTAATGVAVAWPASTVLIIHAFAY